MQIIRRAASSTFLRHNLIFFFGSLLVSFLNYLYYPIVGRLLSPADFGEVQAIMSFFLQAAVFLQVLGLLTVGVIKKYENTAQRSAITTELEWVALLAGIAGFILAIITSPFLESFLHFRSPIPFIIFAFAILLGVPLALSNAYLQAFKRFGVLAWSNIVSATTKLIFSGGLIVAGLRTNGAVAGLAIASLLSVIYTTWLARRVGRPRLHVRRDWPNLAIIRPELGYAGLVLTIALCSNVVLSVDVIAVKHFFNPHDAGLYAGIATVARIIFFLTGPLAVVLIGSIKLGDSEHNRQLLLRSMLLMFLLGGACLTVFTLAPSLVLSILIGGRYTAYASLLPKLSLAIFILSLSNLLMYYHMALRRAIIAPIAILGLITMGFLLANYHHSIPQVVNSLLVGGVILFILVTVVSIQQYLSRRDTP